MKKNIIIFLKLVVSVITIHSVLYVTGNVDNKFSTANILTIFLFIGINILFIKYLNKIKGKSGIVILIAFLLGFSNVIGYNIYSFETSKLNDVYTYVYLIGQSLLFYSLINVVISNFNEIKKIFNNIELNFIKKYFFNRFVILKTMLVILIAWIPILLIFYPGNYGYDSPGEFLDYFNGNYISGNPPAHGFLIGTIMKFGHNVFQSYNIGILLFCIIQMFFMAYVYGNVIKFMVDRKTPTVWVTVTLLIFMFLPTHSIMSLTTTKDVMFSGVTVLFFLRFFKYYVDEHGGKEYNWVKRITSFIDMFVLCFFMFGFRHNGIYGYCFMIIFAFIFLRKYWKSLLLFTISVLLTFNLYNNFLDKYAYITVHDPTTVTPAYIVVPYQQMARVYPYTSKKEKEELNKFMKDVEGNIGWLYYTPRRADGVFLHANNPYFHSHKIEFLKIYLNMIKKYPLQAIDAFLDNCIAYWYSADLLPDKTTIRPYIEFNIKDPFDITNDEIKLDSKINLYHDVYKFIVEGEFQKLPILNFFMSTATNSLSFFIIVFVLLKQRRFKELASMMIFVGNMGICLLAPTCVLRYMYYIPIVLPALLCIVFKNNKGKKAL